MQMWTGMRRAWAIAFVITWFAVTIALNTNGWSDNASVRLATLAAALVALVVWFVTKRLGSGSDAPEE